MRPAERVEMGVKKSFQCWLEPVPSALRSLGGSQEPRGSPLWLAQCLSFGLDEAHCGMTPKVYCKSMLFCCAAASHASNMLQSYRPGAVLIKAQLAPESHRRVPPNESTGQGSPIIMPFCICISKK